MLHTMVGDGRGEGREGVARNVAGVKRLSGHHVELSTGTSAKNYNIPVVENSWKHKPKGIIENKNIALTYDLMIPSSVNIEIV